MWYWSDDLGVALARSEHRCGLARRILQVDIRTCRRREELKQ
jgi:hypothetical protein